MEQIISLFTVPSSEPYKKQTVGNCSFYNMQLALSAGQDKEMMRSLLSFEEQVTLNLRAYISGQSGASRRLRK